MGRSVIRVWESLLHELTGSCVQAFEGAHREGGHFRRPHTCSARSMPIFMVPAEEGQVPHAPCTPVTKRQAGSSHT